MDRVAVNASPLIVLANAGHANLLRAVANRIILPAQVGQEIERRGDGDKTVQFLRSVDWIDIIESITIPPDVAAWDLGEGESALLAWGLQNPTVELIVDDRQARHCADALGLRTRGTLSVVIRAKQSGVIAAARPVIEDLRRAGIYLSDALALAVLTAVGE
jgi:predicted nucleic acid-binding protein